MTLTRQDILSSKTLRTEEVEIPEFGGTIIVRELTGSERDEYESSIVRTDVNGNVSINRANLRAKLVILSVVDGSGERLFSGKDIAAVGKLSAAALDRIVDVSKRLSRIAEDDLGKSSTGDPSNGSASS